MRRATGIRLVIALAVPQLFLAACGGGGSGGGGAPSGSSGAQIVAASAPSKHYVEVSFSEPVDGGAVQAERYSITAAGGGALAVHEAHVGDDASVVVLTTDAQAAVRYDLEMESSQAGSASFTGAAEVGEPFLRSAVALDNTHVLLTFSEPMQGGASKASYYRVVALAGNPPQDVGGVHVVSAALSGDGKTVTLTTSPQDDYQYTVVVTNVGAAAGALIDPTRNSTTFYGILPIDTSGPRVTGAVATNSTAVIVSFSEPLLKTLLDNPAENPSNYHLDPSVAVIGAVLDPTGTQVTLATLPLTAGIQYRVTVADVKDRAGNGVLAENDAALFTFAGQGGVDDELPRVVGVSSTSNLTVVVQYSKPMSDSALDLSRYFIKLEPSGAVITLVGRCVDGEHEGHLCASPGLEVKVCEGSSPNPGRVCQAAAECRPATCASSGDCDAATCEVACTGSTCQGARFLDTNRTQVEIQTLSQNDGIYTLTATGATDLAGNPLAPKQVVAGTVVDPASGTFPGTGPYTNGMIPGNAGVDSDGDGMPDTDEQSGWDVTVYLLNGQTSTAHMTANPLFPDTDGDGLVDPREFAIGSNPRSNDSDGEGLTDYEEYNVVYSDPTRQDSDGDGISDDLEVEFFKTNAILGDSDGDGFSDSEELFEMNRDPRIADLPTHEIVVGEVTMRINEEFTYTDENGDTRVDASSTSTSLSQGESHSYNTLDQTVTNVMASLNFGFDSCQTDKACDEFFLELSRVFLNTGISGGAEWTSATTKENVAAAEEAFEDSLEKAHEISTTSTVTRAVVGARIDAEVELRNASDVAFTLSNVEITVETTSPDDPTKVVPVATLLPNSTLLTGAPAEFNIGPYQSRSAVLFSNREVFPNMVEDLMRAPRALMFRVSNFDLKAEDGRNFAFGLQTVRERTTGVVVDFGDGTGQQTYVTTAPVLNRPRNELRCASGGDHPDRPCATDDDCGTSRPCEGGQVIGGLAGYGGTGRPSGIPLDYVLRDLLHRRKTNPPSIVAGPDGIADTQAAGDDVQVVGAGTFDLPPDAVVIAAGLNGVLDTAPAGDDLNPTPPDGILAGRDKYAMSIAAGDDVQLVPAGTEGVPEDAIVVGAGENGILETQPRGDDIADVVTGYETSLTCNADTLPIIFPGPNGTLESSPRFDDFIVVLPFVPPAPPPLAIISPIDGVLNSIAGGDDVTIAPGVACSQDSDCVSIYGPNGRCNGPEQVVRVDNRRNGQFRRKWLLLLPDQSQFQTDVGQVRMRAGQVLALAFVQDLDRDGLIAPVEFMNGSSDFESDTDRDGLGDFSEVRIGWDVGAVGQPLRHVFPDPANPDSDGDGLTDREEQDLRALPHFCPAGGCTGDFSLYRIDPRRRDTDGDGVSDTGEVFGYLTGRGLLDPIAAIIAGTDRTANTVACPMSHCNSLSTRHCVTDADCPDHNCVQQAGCDDVQLDTPRTGVQSERTVVVSAGLNGQLETDPATGDVRIAQGDGRSSTQAFGDDVPIVGLGETVEDMSSGRCLDGSQFAMCAIVRPGPDGQLQSQPLGDDVVARYGQIRERSDPLSPDTDMDQVADGIEQVLGSSPNDPGDTGSPADSDQDGLTDAQESTSGWDVYVAGKGSRHVSSNPYVADTDADGLPDYAERAMPCFEPRTCVSAGSFKLCAPGMASACDSDADCQQGCPTDPTNADTDGDGIGDYDELSANQFSVLKRFNEFFRGYNLDDGDSQHYGIDPTSSDSDKDGLDDAFELFEGWTVTRADGSLTSVLSDPQKADSDNDGRNDGQEFRALCFGSSSAYCPTDASDPDTDDDGRLDGAEQTLGTNPLVEDLSIRLRFSRIEVERITDPGGSGNAEFGWWIVLRSSALGAQNPLLLSSAQRYACETNLYFTPYILSNAGHCLENPAVACNHRGTQPVNGVLCTCQNRCFNINVNIDAFHSTIALDSPLVVPTRRGEDCPQSVDLTAPPIVADKTFTLQKGQSFTVDGLLSELDAASPDCGWPPNYLPSTWTSGCYTRFSKTYNFDDLQRGGLGETLAVNPVSGGTQGGDGCTWQLEAFLEVK